MLPFFIILLSAALATSSTVLGVNEIRIKTSKEFVAFANDVNNGANYSGTTVFLDANIDFSGTTMEPIGKSKTGYFNGTFDGQGHVLSNLHITSDSSSTGLFGYSRGMTVKNLVIDSTSSTESSTTGDEVFVGSIIGLCYTDNSFCRVENCVNMGSINFRGEVKNNLYIGGLAGYVYSSAAQNSLIKNSANYGAIICAGKNRNVYIGGIVGRTDGYFQPMNSSKKVVVQNVYNFGIISNIGITLSWTYVGGIIGYGYYSDVSNCLDSGAIACNAASNHLGSIAGKLHNTGLTHCYLSSSSKYEACGTAEESRVSGTARYDENTYKLLEAVTVGKKEVYTLIDALNAGSDYYALRDYSHWLLNKDGKTVAFIVDNAKRFTMNSKVIVLPDFAKYGQFRFDGWYTDSGCTTALSNYEVTSDMSVYGNVREDNNYYTIIFVARDRVVSPEPIKSKYLSVVELPVKLPKDRKCFITSWETENGYAVEWNFTVPAHDITLYPVLTCPYITNAEEFITFAKNVSAGTSYQGTTVYLDADIDFSEVSEKMEPIGQIDENFFRGTFDGQGHVIKNLNINSSQTYVGLFGYTKGITSKNFVFDESCSVQGFIKGSNVYVGGAIAFCDASERPCIAENIVNMGSVMFTGTVSLSMYLGGICGSFEYTSSYECNVVNCANYGPIIDSGINRFTRIGSIIGSSKGYSIYKRVRIYNCLNYGTVAQKGLTSDHLYIGGIYGDGKFIFIENCMNVGAISTINTTTYIGTIGGNALSTVMANCFWTSDVGYNKSHGGSTSIPDNNTYQVTLGTEVVDELNNHSAFNAWNKWVFNPNNAPISFVVNNENGLVLDSQIILLPGLSESNERNFTGWYKDNTLTEPFEGNKVDSATTLYGMFCALNYFVTLDVNGGDTSSLPSQIIDVECNGAYGTLPIPTMSGYAFDGWYTGRVGGKKVESGDRITCINDHTLYAHWNKQ